MNWQAIDAACAFYTVGRIWSPLREELGDGKRRQLLLVACLLVSALWPLVWLVAALEFLRERRS